MRRMPGSDHGARRHRWVPREVRWGVTALAIGVVGYLLLPALSGARKSLHQIAHVRIPYLVAGVVLAILYVPQFAPWLNAHH